MSRAKLWLLVLPVVLAGCLATGAATSWSANGVAAVVAVGLAYLAVPPMVVALIEWQGHRAVPGLAPARAGETGESGTGIGAAVPAPAGDERGVRARAERSDAFKELWKIVQDAHIGVRNDFDRADELASVHRRLNIILIEKAPALDDADVQLAHDFLGALGEFIRLLRPLPGASADQVRQDIEDTAAGPRLVDDIDILHDSYARMLDANAALRKRYRDVVFGENA